MEVESRLIVGRRVSDAPNEKEQLAPTLEAVSPAAGSLSAALLDSGYYSEKAVMAVEQGGQGPTIDAATKRHGHGRSMAQLEERPDPPAPPEEATMDEIMRHRLETNAGKKRYALRKQTVEPVFGIIKEAMGFRRFSIRGLEKVDLEWTLVTAAYNLKRLFHLG